MTPADLRTTRTALGLSLTRLGELVAPPVTRHHLSDMERGARTIGPGMAARLREALARAARKPQDARRRKTAAST